MLIKHDSIDFHQVNAAVEKLQAVEAGLTEQITESELRMQLMQEAILDIDKVCASALNVCCFLH